MLLYNIVHYCIVILFAIVLYLSLSLSFSCLLQSKTFPVTFNNRSAGLTLEWTQGFTLSYEGIGEIAWRYKFSQLRGSSDDGKSRLKLHFQEPDSIAIETKVCIKFYCKTEECHVVDLTYFLRMYKNISLDVEIFRATK